MIELDPGESSALKKQTVKLSVRYAPAKHPYKDPHADLSTSLAEIKATVLVHFQLSEGTIDGGTKTYQLSFDDIVQSNLSVTLGNLDPQAKEVEILLIEQFVQG